jgi:hypothetical protein
VTSFLSFNYRLFTFHLLKNSTLKHFNFKLIKTDELTAKHSDETLQTFGFYVKGNGKCLNKSNELDLGDRRRQIMNLATIKAKALIYSDYESTLSTLIQVKFEASKRNLLYFFCIEIFNFKIIKA